MQPRERRETGEQDLFRSRLDQIIDMKHPLVALGRTVDREFREREFGAVYTDDPGRWRSSSTATTSPTRCCVSAGSRTPITSSSAARSS
jgi:hypothetical protein